MRMQTPANSVPFHSIYVITCYCYGSKNNVLYFFSNYKTADRMSRQIIKHKTQSNKSNFHELILLTKYKSLIRFACIVCRMINASVVNIFSKNFGYQNKSTKKVCFSRQVILNKFNSEQCEKPKINN